LIVIRQNINELSIKDTTDTDRFVLYIVLRLLP